MTHRNVKEKNILTLEDPVEIQLEGINQVPVHLKAGLSFATLLRAFLRQDPDIIMVGEIRDLETAKIVIQAAQTGHLVLSTLHTNSSAEALTRLVSMGIPHYSLVEVLRLIVAQRLIRKLCALCKQIDTQSFFLKEQKHKNKVYRASGCPSCRQGYSGRIALFECFPLNEKLLQLALKTKNTEVLVKAAQKEGFKTLREMGLEKIFQGETSFAELARVLTK